MSHYVHQVVANFVCLLFGAGKVVYSGFIRAFFCGEQLAAVAMRAVRVKNQKNKLKDTKRLSGTAELGGFVTTSDTFLIT